MAQSVDHLHVRCAVGLLKVMTAWLGEIQSRLTWRFGVDAGFQQALVLDVPGIVVGNAVPTGLVNRSKKVNVNSVSPR